MPQNTSLDKPWGGENPVFLRCSLFSEKNIVLKTIGYKF
jgi:hypothetical protein